MNKAEARLIGIYLFVSDLEASSKFYETLGLEIERVSKVFARASWGEEVVLELGTDELTQSYDPHYQRPGELSKSTINFELNSAQAVDAKFVEMTSAGYTGHLGPCDAPWQARFAIVADPDGNFMGFHSPRDRAADRVREGAGP